MIEKSFIVTACLFCTLFCACAQRAPAQQTRPAPSVLMVSGAAAVQSESQTVRAIVDPSNGDRWLLERDPAHPGGPGRLVRIPHIAAPGVAGTTGVARIGNKTGDRIDEAAGTASTGAAGVYQPVIHAGDRVIVEENTPVVEARLAAVALTPAEAGSTLTVRLAIGGKVMQAVASGPGRAAFAPEAGAQP